MWMGGKEERMCDKRKAKGWLRRKRSVFVEGFRKDGKRVYSQGVWSTTRLFVYGE